MMAAEQKIVVIKSSGELLESKPKILSIAPKYLLLDSNSGLVMAAKKGTNDPMLITSAQEAKIIDSKK